MKLEFSNKYLQYIIGIPSIAFIIFVVYSYHTNRIERIKSNCTFTLGELLDVHEGGEAFDISVDYQYFVNEKKYERTVEIDHGDKRNFSGWWRDRDRSNQFVWVIYSNDNHEESLVNLFRIFTAKDTSDLVQPINYNGFY